MDAKERYLWDLNGHLIVCNVLSEEDLKAANDAIDFCADRIVPGDENRLSRGSTFCRAWGVPDCRAPTCSTSKNHTATSSANCSSTPPSSPA